ncbi:MAG: GtrA family protein [Arhodomonas sp.]|nr:GtrA family protein [Arhodomonas sp.]
MEQHRTGIALAYTAFAALAVLVNILTQAGAVVLYSGTGALALSIAAGTAAGLVTKYLLDKRYIFAFRARDAAHDLRTFLAYTATGWPPPRCSGPPSSPFTSPSPPPPCATSARYWG